MTCDICRTRKGVKETKMEIKVAGSRGRGSTKEGMILKMQICGSCRETLG